MSIDRDKVTELLKNYRSYRYAIRMYETTGWAAISGTCSELGMPRNGSFGPRAPARFAADSWQDTQDYQRYSRVVRAIEGAVDEVLGDEEQNVIRHKYMERNTLTLAQIADKFGMSERRALYLHKKALKALALALMFVEVPEIVNLDHHLAKVPV